MKKTLKLFAMALMAGAAFTSCDDKTGGDNGTKPTPGGDGNYPPIELDELISGTRKAGIAGEIAITGSGFDREMDWIYVDYTDDKGVKQSDRVTDDVLDIGARRVSFGVKMSALYLDKPFTVYLERGGDYDRMPISGEITLEMPTVADGWIPDAGFRATLMSDHPNNGNPNIAPLFDKYGLIPPAAAASVKKSGVKNAAGEETSGLNLYASTAKSLEGIELFTHVEGNIEGWGMTQIEEVDFSKWTAQGISLLFNGSKTLKKFVGSPYAYYVAVHECEKLTHVDLSPCKWAYNAQVWYNTNPNGTIYSSVTYLDIRKQREGKEFRGEEGVKDESQYPSNPETDYATYMGGSAYFKPADKCHILVDYQFLTEKRGTELDGSGYGGIYGAWVRGATIDVYDSKDITKKIGTVPLHSVDDKALTLTGENGWKPEGY